MSVNRLFAPISDEDTSLILDYISELPPSGILKIDDEYILYGFASDFKVVSLTRGFAGSSAAAHDRGTLIELATIADLSTKTVSVQSYVTAADETLDIVLPDPTDVSVPQIVIVSHREDSDGDFSVNTVTIEAGDSKLFAWDGTSWTTEPASGGGSGASTALDNLAAVQINSSLLFDADDTYDVGDASNAVQVVYAHEIQTDTVSPFSGGALVLSNCDVNPSSDNSQTLGVADTAEWAELNIVNVTHNDSSGDSDMNIGIGSGDGSLVLYAQAAGTINLQLGSSLNLQVDSDATAGNTRLLLWDVDSGTLQRVKVTADDAVLGVTGRVLFIDDLA